MFKKASSYKFARLRAAAANKASLRARSSVVSISRNPISSVGQIYPAPRRGRGAEIKFLDTTVAIVFDNAGAVGTCLPINLTAQGILVNQRLANSITCKSVSLSGEIQGAGQSVATQGCRTMIVWDKQPTPGTAVTAGTILTTTDVSGNYNPSTKDRFKIIYDSRTAVGPLQIPTNAPGIPYFNPNCSPIKPVSVYRSLSTVETTMNGAAAIIANCQTNSLYLLTLGDQPNGAGVNPTLLVQCRVRYTDS